MQIFQGVELSGDGSVNMGDTTPEGTWPGQGCNQAKDFGGSASCSSSNSRAVPVDHKSCKSCPGFLREEVLTKNPEAGLMGSKTQYQQICAKPIDGMASIWVTIWRRTLRPEELHDFMFTFAGTTESEIRNLN